MSLRKQVLQGIDDLIVDHIEGVFGVIERAVIRKQSEPARWAAFHSEMSRRLPRWRRLAKAWHRMRSRRFGSLVKVSSVSAQLRKAYPSV